MTACIMQHKSKLFSLRQNKGERKKKYPQHIGFLNTCFNPCNAQKNLENIYLIIKLEILKKIIDLINNLFR